MSTGNEDMQGTNRQRKQNNQHYEGQTINANCFRASKPKRNDMSHF